MTNRPAPNQPDDRTKAGARLPARATDPGEPEAPGYSRGPARKFGFHWSFFTLAICGALAIAAVLWVSRRPLPPGSIPSGGQTGPGTTQAHGVPTAPFSDVTQKSGIQFVHFGGAYGEKLLPETMGGGVAFLDCDADGDQDLLFVNSTYWPDKLPAGTPAPTMALYANQGNGTFQNITQGSGIDISAYGMGAAIGDYDGDGLQDIFITAVGPNHLFRNLGGGKFEDVTSFAGIAGDPAQWSTSAAWFDYDRDGDLDLFVCNYVRWSREIDLAADYKLPGVGRAYGPPMNFAGSMPYLYRNDGQGRFTDVSDASGIQIRNPKTGLPMAKSLGVVPFDPDGDGWLDLVVANDTVQNFVFTNRHNGTFAEIGASAGIAFDRFGATRGAMGIDTARFSDENQLAIAIGNFANEMTAFYVSQRDPTRFADEAIAQGIGSASKLSLTFGVFFFDYDLDGRLDLLTANGHIEEAISTYQPGQTYRQPAILFWNTSQASGPPGFIAAPESKTGPALVKPIVGRGSAYADIDGDGDLDVVLTQIAGPPLLLRNDQALGHHWVRLKLVGKSPNSDAIGAVIRLRAGARTQWAMVNPTRGYLSQSELVATFGLGKSDRIDDLEITWPNGAQESLPRLNIDALNIVKQR